VVEVRGKLFLLDCGEGTQVQLRRSRVRFTKISAVFITHLHGDHCFGLPGMLSTFGLLGRTAPLAVYAPGALFDVLRRQMDLFCSGLDYEVKMHAVDTRSRQVVYEDRSLTVNFDGREVSYDVTELDELVLAYATTIHKAQGSEYPVVVMPVLMSHYMMLQRNLIYTGVTRAKRGAVVVGTRKALAVAIRNVNIRRRNTRLAFRLGTAGKEEAGG
jgi:ribonuclease BN (tRNA processing enzyme)